MSQIRLRGSYINLDRSVDRRADMEHGLNRHGLGRMVKRFPAIEPDEGRGKLTRGEWGCFLSHQAIVDAADDGIHILVLEDDLIFPEAFGSYFRPALEIAFRTDWDILFLNQTASFLNLAPLRSLLGLKRTVGDMYSADFRNFRVIDAKNFYLFTAAAYIIHPRARKKVSTILAENSALDRNVPVDILYGRAIHDGRLTAKFLFPYLVGIDHGYETTMAGRAFNSDTKAVVDMINLFVAGLDTTQLRAEAAATQNADDFDADAFVASQIVYRRFIA